MTMDTNQSKIKQYAIKTLDCFDQLAKPEIKNRVMSKIWDYLKSYTLKIILRKPDKELKTKLFKIHQTLNPLFSDLDNSIQMKAGELLGSPKIPNVGELGKIKELISEKSVNELLQELKLTRG